MQVHYHPTGKPETDRSKVAVYFVDRPRNGVAAIWVASHAHDIPAGKKDYRVSASYTLPRDLLLLGVVPHMHLLGRSLRATATLPDGKERPLLEIRRWDFNWQDDYRFARPIRLPRGTRLRVEASYDNSADNPCNPSSPPRRVTWGEGTRDEMLYCFFLVAAANPKELTALVQGLLARELVGQLRARARKRGR
jgi:hypothetical protein